MRKIYIGAVALMVTLLGLTAGAFAAGVATPDNGQNWLDAAKPVFDAIMHGQGWLAASLGVVMLCALARAKLPDAWGGKFVRNSDTGGVVLAFAVSFAGMIATSAAAVGFTMSGALALTALKVALGAAGGYSVLHKLASDLVATKWWADHAPAWLKALVALALRAIGSNAIAKAEAAGTAAVQAKPDPGVVAVAGTPTELE